MKSVEILQKEHQLIRHLLNALDALVEKTERSGKLPEETANELLKLFELFADGTHQEKEERFLFARLLERASEQQAQKILRLLTDHEGEHQRMMSMWSHLTSSMFGEPISVREFLRDAREYLRFHRDHMTHEGVIVFPLAEELLGESDDLEIVRGFEEIDKRASPAALEERIRRTCIALGVTTELEGTKS